MTTPKRTGNSAGPGKCESSGVKRMDQTGASRALLRSCGMSSSDVAPHQKLEAASSARRNVHLRWAAVRLGFGFSDALSIWAMITRRFTD